MKEKILSAGLILAAFLILIAGCVQQSSDTEDEFCVKNGTNAKLSLKEAREIALKSECAKVGTLTNKSLCNNYTGTWWIDLEPFTEKKGCNPACVVDIKNRTAEVNWRCTGLITQ